MEFSNYFWDFLSFKEYTLRNSTVSNFWLSDENSLIRQVVINLNFPDSIVLQPAFDNMFLEVGIES